MDGYSEFKDALGFFAKTAMKGADSFSGAIKLNVDIYRKRNLPLKLLILTLENFAALHTLTLNWRFCK